MAATGDQPVSASNLSAALGAGAGSGLTGTEPICVDNLRAALSALGAEVLYDGPKASGEVQLAKSMEGFDYIAVETVSETGSPRDPELVYGLVCAVPYAMAVGYSGVLGTGGNGFVVPIGEVCDGPDTPKLTGSIGFPASGRYDAVHLTDNDKSYAVLRVFGMRFKEGAMQQSEIHNGGGQLLASLLLRLLAGEVG